MSIGDSRRYSTIDQPHQFDHRRPSLFAKSPFPSPSSLLDQQQGAKTYDQPAPERSSHPPLPSPKYTPSMQIPQRQPPPVLRDPFPFTSPSNPSSLSHSSHAAHHHHPMARRDSFPSQHPSTSPVNLARPRAPPLRIVKSAYTPREEREASPTDDAGAGPSKETGKRNSGDGDMDELTTKGRKRKRLAKACSACHKNKRRCDGFAPCSNCEFSSRPCLYLNALGETIPPPRTRDSIGQQGSGATTPALAKGKAGSKSMSQTGSGQGIQGRGSMQDSKADFEDGRYDVPGPRGSSSIPAPVERRPTVAEVVDSDPVLSAELIDTFFRISAPFNAMFHPPTFQHRLYLSQTSPVLLDAIYAFAARSSTSPALLACYPPDHPPWLRGEGFAERAHAEAERIVTARDVELESGPRRKQGTWEELEEIQAFTLLSIYFACLRQPTLALFYLDMAMSMLRPTFLSPARVGNGMSPVEQATLAESKVRTFWLIALHDLCAAANGRPRMLTDAELEGVALPGVESLWVRYGGGTRSGVDDRKRRDGMIMGSGNWSGDEGEVGELGHVLRILSIFSNIMAVANGTEAAPDARLVPLHQHQDALKSWAQNLPLHLRFDEHNLSASITRLQSPISHVAFSGWAFGYMHAIAECGMFYLQAAVAQQPGSSWTAQRQQQAVDNIAVVLDAMGERGREGPLMLFPIAVVSNWQDHIRSINPAPTPSQLQLDDRLTAWWTEAKLQWGAERAQALEKGYQPGTKGPVMPIYAGEAYSAARHEGGAAPRSASTSDGRYQSQRGYDDHSYDRRYSEYDPAYHRRPSPTSGPHRLQHLLDPSPISIAPKTEASDVALGLYSFASTSPRDIMAQTAMRNGRSHGSVDGYPSHPYSRSELHDPYSRQSQSSYRHSPPELAHSISTSASHLIPTPYSSRPNLPPLPSHGARPRAISSVVPYSTRDTSPVSARAFGSTADIERRLPPSLSFSEVDGTRRHDEGQSSAGSKGNYFPPSAELRQLRQLDDPRSNAGSPGLGLGFSKGWMKEPTSLFDRRGPEESRREGKGDAAEGEPFGIAALLSAAESEREREEKRRESEGSSNGQEDTGKTKEDVEMREEAPPGQAQVEQAVVA